jgi:hypothetical protein
LGNDKEEWNNNNRDKLNEDYDSVLRESALMTTVAGIVFGFILNISVNPPQDFDLVDKIILTIALFSVVIATLLFSMPVIYHHIQYPYSRFDKFQLRSHRFIVFGIIPFFFTMYLSLTLAIQVFLNLSSFVTIYLQLVLSFILASIPFVIVYILYRKRK